MIAIQPNAMTLWKALLNAGLTRSFDYRIAEDATGTTMTYRDLISRSYAFARTLACLVGRDERRIGLMLPNGLSMITCFFGVQALGRTAAMMNFAAGPAAVNAACAVACIRTVVTSRKFVEAVQLGGIIETITLANVRVLYLEDLAASMGGFIKAAARFARIAPRLVGRRGASRDPNAEAVVLFTSGSEGTPKGVALSHKNILTNIVQFLSRITMHAEDVMFACLPLFHSFGLTVGGLLPLLGGVRVFFYTTPLHYHEIPGLIRQKAATILLGTDTFLTGYARCGDAEDFRSLRYIVAGAERFKDETHRLWNTRFNKEILEGYGVTEASPVISVNTPEEKSMGSVGRLLPGLEARIEPVEGLAEGGRLFVKGGNVMLGYLMHDNPGVVQPLVDGWHDTGDVVNIDADGYLTILGRVKRFAKIGGEMISLTAIERLLAQLWPDKLHAAVSIPHARKGESIVVLTEYEEADPEQLPRHFRQHGFPELAIPRRIIHVEKVPILGAGKIDYLKSRAIALEAEGGQSV